MIPMIEEQQVFNILHNIDQSELVDEIKHIMMTGQNIPNKFSPYKMIAVRPQGCNEVCDLIFLLQILHVRNIPSSSSKWLM